ncbi:MAG: hypothetical protein AAGA87_08810 [Pseudomonadota bacterium]
MQFSVVAWAVMVSGALSAVAFLPYILDTLRRQTQPERASWLIWSVLSTIAFFSQVYEGATTSLWFVAVQVSGTILVCLLSVKRGVGGFMRRSDRWILIAAALGLMLWYFTSSAAYALAVTISISLLGGSVTVLKAYFEPRTETFSTWVLFLIASALALFSVGELDWVLLAYPMYLTTLYGAIVLAMVIGRARERWRATASVGAAIATIEGPFRGGAGGRA